MKIKLINKENPISLKSGLCFLNAGFALDIIKKINSGKEVTVDKIPKSARELVEQVKKKVNKKKGDK